MQSEHQSKPELDSDILQCREDVQRALQEAKRTRSKPLSEQPEQLDQPSQAAQPPQSSQPENGDKKSLEPKQESGPIGLRIMSFEAMQNKQHNANAAPDTSPQPPTQPENNIPQSSQNTDETLNETLEQIESLQEQNRQLAVSHEESVESAKSKQQHIEELERQLAETISELSALKLQAEQTAETLTAQAQQLHRAGDEKTALEKQLEEQTAEWTRTLETLKAAQETASRTLLERNSRLESLQAELSEAESRLEQADSANAELSRENAELTETLREAQIQIRQYVEAHETDAIDEESPEPYCEPADEVISEDDVHLEQKLVDDEKIPSFNLAEQIMAEQRKASAARRQRPPRSGEPTQSGAVEHVMEQYISAAQRPAPPARTPSRPPSQAVEHGVRFPRWQDEYLSDHQQTLLSTIVQKDIRQFCDRKASWMSLHRPMGN